MESEHLFCTFENTAAVEYNLVILLKYNFCLTNCFKVLFTMKPKSDFQFPLEHKIEFY